MALPWDTKALDEGRVPPTIWIVLAIVVALIALIVFSVTRPAREELIGSVVIFTDQAIGSDTPEDCLQYGGREVTIRSLSGDLLWTGETDYEFGDIRIPDLGCEVMFFTDPIPVVEQIEATIEGLPTHRYDFQEVLDDNYGIISWDAICIHHEGPCPPDKGNYLD